MPGHGDDLVDDDVIGEQGPITVATPNTAPNIPMLC